MKSRIPCFKFIWVVTAAHFIGYFIAGLFASRVLDYNNLFSTEEMAVFMRPVSSPVVFLGPVFQLIRGLLLGFILLPVYSMITGEKYGILKLGVLILGLCLISTIGPVFGSFDGLIYTRIPVKNQFLTYIEAIPYITLFCTLIWIPFRFDKKWIHITYLSFIVIVSALLIVGYINSVR